MLIGLNLKLPRPNVVAGVGGGAGGGALLAADPSLYLDFIAGQTGYFGDSADQTLDLSFTGQQYQVAATTAPTYGPGLYLVQG